MKVNRRTIIFGALASATGVGAAIADTPKSDNAPLDSTILGREIPVIWVAPEKPRRATAVVIWLASGISGTKEAVPQLKRLAAEGYLAVSFDSWARGSRAKDSFDVLFPIAMSNWPFYGWPILGIGAMETMRVMDWAIKQFGTEPQISVGGVSLGGDIAIAAAGLDKRITCAAVANSTPDWRRPGMHAYGKLVEPGMPDAYAQFLYDRINPFTNLSSYAHCPAITFECGADDVHVPADGALRFRTALAGQYEGAMERLQVNLHSTVKHEFTPAMLENCIKWLNKYAGSRNV
jgi:uncharacterized protein